jgi:hypothetical protein
MFQRQYNKYIFYDDYVVGITNKGYTFTIDKQFYDLVKDYCWEYESKRKRVVANSRETKNYKVIALHRLILGLIDNKYKDIAEDHIDRCPLNNRISNLRTCHNRDNAKNTSKPKNSNCPFMGVSWCHNRYEARIGYNKKKIHLGSYENIEDAIIARLKAEKEYFGDFAPQRHLFKEYNIE